MNLISKILLLILFIANKGQSQNVSNHGNIYPSIIEESDILSQVGKKGSLKVPLQYSLKKYCPKPANQNIKSLGACQGFAFAYAGMTIANAIRNKMINTDSITASAFSAYYTFHFSRYDISKCKFPPPFERTAETLLDSGSVLSSHFDATYQCYPTYLNKSILKSAVANRIKSVESIFDMYINLSANYNSADFISILKQAISRNKPVILAIAVDASFVNNIFTRIYVPQISKKIGEHAVTLIGYDDISKEFEIINSYGTEWGNEGFFKISYNDLFKICYKAFTISLFNQNDFSADLRFNIRKPDIRESKTNVTYLQTLLTKISTNLYEVKLSNTMNPCLIHISTPMYINSIILSKDENSINWLLKKNQYVHSRSLNLNNEGYIEFSKGDKLIVILSRNKIGVLNLKYDTIQRINEQLLKLLPHSSSTVNTENNSIYSNIHLELTAKEKVVYTILQIQ